MENRIKKVMTAGFAILAISALVLTSCQLAVAPGNDQPESLAFLDRSCTTFFTSYGDTALLGDSEDMGADHPLAPNPEESIVWFYPSSSPLGGRYGLLALGWFWNDGVSFQSGMNGKGLGLGLTAVPATPLNAHPDKPFSPSTHGGLYYRILWDAANVTEAIQIARDYDLRELSYQILVADSSGDAVIISPGPNGELAFSMKESGDGFLVASTFNCAMPASYIGADSFKRRDAAVSALEELMDGPGLTVDHCRSILDSVHRQGSVQLGAYTGYSSTFDLQNGVVHIYYLSQFDDPVELDMGEEVARGQHHYRLRDLVPVGVREQALAQYRAAQTRGWITISGIGVGMLMLVGGLTAFGYRRLRKRRKETAG